MSEAQQEFQSYDSLGCGNSRGALRTRSLRAAAISQPFRRNCHSKVATNLPGIKRYRQSSRTCFEGPFGELLRATGPMAKANPIRFSTQYTDDETDLVCYLHRYYNPSTGRWLSRDPINEPGFQLFQQIQPPNRSKKEPVQAGSVGLPRAFKQHFKRNSRFFSVGTEMQKAGEPVGRSDISFIDYQFCRNDPIARFDVNGLKDIDGPGCGYFVTQIGIAAALALLDWGIYNYVCSDIPPDQEAFIRTPGSAAATIANLLAIGAQCGSAGGLVYMHIWSDSKCGCHRNYVIICNSCGPGA